MTQFKTNTKLFTIIKEKTIFPNIKIIQSIDSYNFIKQFYSNDIDVYESMFAIFLNRLNNTVGVAKLSQGGISSTLLDVRLLVKYTIDSLASSVILIHNHPSGGLIPSTFDKDITKKCKEALLLLDISLLDHLIVTSENYYSFSDEGDL